MSMITQSYILDLVPNGTPLVVYVSQYDKASRELEFTLHENGHLFTPPSGSQVFIKGTKPDKTGFYYSMSLEYGQTYTRAVISVKEQMTAVAGPTLCEVVVTDSLGNTLGSNNFILYVEKAALDDDEVISESDIPVFEEMVSQASAAASSASASAAAAQASAESISGVADQVEANTANIATNTADIATNASNIADNSSNIATNTANITANTNSITSLTSDLATKAPIASPALTGTPTAPTQATANNSTAIATTAYVKNNLASYDTSATVDAKIANASAVTETRPTLNYNYTLIANADMKLHKTGHVVMLSGWLNNTIACKQYDWLFTIPAGYRPINNVSIISYNNTEREWIFVVGADGKASPQTGDLPTGVKYYTTTWITA